MVLAKILLAEDEKNNETFYAAFNFSHHIILWDVFTTVVNEDIPLVIHRAAYIVDFQKQHKICGKKYVEEQKQGGHRFCTMHNHPRMIFDSEDAEPCNITLFQACYLIGYMIIYHLGDPFKNSGCYVH